MSTDYDYLLQADGGSRGNPGTAGYGAVIYDRGGNKIADVAGPLGKATNNVAEYSGLVAGLELIAERDKTATVHVQLDSKLVVEQMTGRWKIKHPDMQDLARKAHKILPPTSVSYEWIPRDQNTVADKLSNEAMDAAAAGHTRPRIRRFDQAPEDTTTAVADQPADYNATLPLELSYNAGELTLTLAGTADEYANVLTWLGEAGVSVQKVGPRTLVKAPVQLLLKKDD
ncbi:reverse transcriptase-like protein [Micrococcoides hystricis]|uniref:Reverse transcriptase-like protein n=1 Tax=Micrococcoides hystricis TaxID=1572761 RepID=A0ABV6PD33_9MICC